MGNLHIHVCVCLGQSHRYCNVSVCCCCCCCCCCCHAVIPQTETACVLSSKFRYASLNERNPAGQSWVKVYIADSGRRDISIKWFVFAGQCCPVLSDVLPPALTHKSCSNCVIFSSPASCLDSKISTFQNLLYL